MPYKSQAQRRLFHHLVKQGKIAPEVVEEYDRESKGKRVPERVERKAHGGEVMEPTTYRARGGEMYVPLKAMGGMIGNMKELYPEGRGSFAKALRRRR